MGQIAVVIDGKSYRMACEDGQEEHVASLAAALDARVRELRGSVGEIGDMRLAVMAAITLADEASELKRKLTESEAALTEARALIAGASDARAADEAATAEVVSALAERVERLAKTLA
jgi:cell division protein ZapA